MNRRVQANSTCGELAKSRKGVPFAGRMVASERKLQILDVTEALVLSSGVESVTMERIAAELGIAKTVIYRHFNHAGAVLLAVMERRWAEIDPHLDAIFQKDFEGNLREALLFYFVDLKAERQLIRRLLEVVNGHPTVTNAWHLRVRSRIDRASKSIVNSFEISPQAARTLAIVCLGSLTWLGGTADANQAAARDKAERLSRFILAGLKAAK